MRGLVDDPVGEAACRPHEQAPEQVEGDDHPDEDGRHGYVGTP